MKYNHSAMRQRFKKEQKALAKKYREAGMSEDSIREMYEFDLAVFRSNRNNLAHKAEIEEMTSYDRITGESHYMDMDEFPLQSANSVGSLLSDKWIDEIENEQLLSALLSLPEDYLEIIAFLMKGYSQTDIGRMRGVNRRAINNKIARIRNKIKKFV